MCLCNRRMLLQISGAVLLGGPSVQASQPGSDGFMREAFRMRAEALSAGDQGYGAVLVLGDHIIGFGPSRVIQDRDPERHAERVAISDAQSRLGRADLSGTVLFSTSIPCPNCQNVAARVRVERMIHGRDLVDAGAPRPLARR